MPSSVPLPKYPVAQNAAESYTLPSAWYTGAAIYELEKEQIFFKSWQYVAHKSLLLKVGDYVVQEICGRSIFVVRAADNSLRAFQNVCANGGHELLGDNICGGEKIICQHCGLASNLTDTPTLDDGQECSPLKAVRVEIFCDCAFVNLDSQAQSLTSQAADLEADIRARIPWFGQLNSSRANAFGNTSIAAGWKVVVDNYVECYHCSPAHPDFASLIDMGSYQVDTFGLWSRQLGADIRIDNSAYAFSPDDGFQASAFWYLWPNTTFNVLPGCEELSVFAVRPTGIAHSSFEGHTLSTGDVFNQARADYTATVLGPEDTVLCESVQRGLHSHAYDQGRIVVDQQGSGIGEQGIHHFHRLMYESLTG